MELSDAGTAGQPHQVSAAELVRNFAKTRQRADAAPVLITNHGRIAYVLCSAAQFHSRASRHQGDANEQGVLDIVQLASQIDDAVVIMDSMGHVLHTNSALLSMVRYDPEAVALLDIFDAFLELGQTIARWYVMRAIRHAEHAQFEMPSPFRPDCWLRCRLAPVGDKIAFLMRDISHEIEAMRMRERQNEVHRAIDLIDDLAFVRLSIRGFIESVNANFTKLIGIPQERLIGHHFSNLVDLRMRAQVSEEFEAVLGRSEDRTIRARLLTDHGTLVDVLMGAAGSNDGYACDGAGIVICRTEGASADIDVLDDYPGLVTSRKDAPAGPPFYAKSCGQGSEMRRES